MSKVLERDDLLAFICETHKGCITNVEFLCENLKVSRSEIRFDMSTVIRVDNGKRYKLDKTKVSWPRGKGNSLTIETPCPYTPLTIA